MNKQRNGESLSGPEERVVGSDLYAQLELKLGHNSNNDGPRMQSNATTSRRTVTPEPSTSRPNPNMCRTSDADASPTPPELLGIRQIHKELDELKKEQLRLIIREATLKLEKIELEQAMKNQESGHNEA